MRRSIREFLILVSAAFVLALGFCPVFCLPADPASSVVTDDQLQRLGLDRNFHQCTSVADGDTLTLEHIGTVRFVGVDTPEKNHPTLPVQYLSQEASDFTTALCLGKHIRLEFDSRDDDKRGNYGRVLGYLYLEDGTFVQDELLKKGLAVAYTRYPLDEDRKLHLLKTEREAQLKEIGLWRDKGLPEAKWILGRDSPMLEVCYIGADKCSLRYWKYLLTPIPFNELETRAAELYGWIYELASRDLDLRLLAAGYGVAPTVPEDSVRFYLMGMAFKKWGILYGKFVKPRVNPGGLGDACEQLVKVIRDVPIRDRKLRLLQRGYRSIWVEYKLPPMPIHRDSDCPSLDGSRKDGALICWDEAGDYIGRTVTVVGEVRRTFKNGQVCFLNFHSNFTRYMGAVIFADKFKYFPADIDRLFLNKTIQVKGRIKEHKGRPEIVIEDPRQIEVID